MTKISNTHKAIIRQSADIGAIMQPVLQKHGMTYFNYFKHYTNGKVIACFTHHDLAEHFFRNDHLKQALAAPKEYLAKPVNYYIWLLKDWGDVLLDSAVYFNVFNGITIAKVNADSVEYFGFGSTLDNTAIINNFYLNNLDLLETYCDYFKTGAARLINRCESNNIILDTSNFNYSEGAFNTQLSERQIDCGMLLLKGISYKDIGKKLNLSVRTVETHVESMKIKLSCNNKTELVVKLIEMLKVPSALSLISH
jgi:DNA-binding CsgD family transcriptional regulator